MIGSVVAMSIWGFNPGIDFKGGSIVEVEYSSVNSKCPIGECVKEIIMPALDKAGFGDSSVRTSGENGLIVRSKELSNTDHEKLLVALKDYGTLTEKRFDSIGPVLGAEALSKSVVSVILVLLAIVLFVTFAFRKVSQPVASWKYGLITVFALLHDVLVPMGVFSVLGHYFGFEVDTLFVTALLVILGFSVHDTIVVFDRVRENLRHTNVGRNSEAFEQVVGASISQTFVRSINTSFTTLLALVVLYFVGPEITKHFSLALLIGITVGTYSSIFLGSPLLVTVEKWQNKN